MTDNQKIPDVFEPLWTGESVFCKCGHHVNMHTTKPLRNNDDYIDNTCHFDNGHFVCPCTGFETKIKGQN
jgi:hypothetical protein